MHPVRRGSTAFRPTAAQEEALSASDVDLAAPRRMLRMLQGDVGSGKTLVALLAMLNGALVHAGEPRRQSLRHLRGSQAQWRR